MYKKLKAKLDRIFAEYVRKRDKGKPCISCGRKTDLEAGHYYSRDDLNLRWDEYNVNGQCAYCNQALRGNRLAYEEGLIVRYGESVVDYLDKEYGTPIKITGVDLENMIDFYKEKLKKL